MERNKVILCFTLAFSVILEWFVRQGAVLLYGSNGFLLWPWIDNIMHFAWGVNIFLIFFVLFKWEPLDALLAVFVWQMLWESIEIIGDRVIPQPDWMLDHFFFDGIKDTVMNLAGAFAAWWLLAWKKRDKHPRRFRGWMRRYLTTTLLLVVGGTAYWGFSVSKGGFTSPDIFTVWWLAISAALIALFEYFKQR